MSNTEEGKSKRAKGRSEMAKPDDGWMSLIRRVGARLCRFDVRKVSDFPAAANLSFAKGCALSSGAAAEIVTFHHAEGPSLSARRSGRAVRLMALILLPLTFVSVACRQDMHDQPKYKFGRESAFFPDQRASRPLVEGTVARGQLRDDKLFYTGKTDAAAAAPAQTTSSTGAQPATSFPGYATTFPFAIDEAALNRGQERYNIYCSVCHGLTGEGDGMVVNRGYRKPPSYHQDRLRQAPAGYLFDVVTNGFGAMPDYAQQISPEDRWKIVAYIRALQVSQQGTPAAELTPDQRNRLNQAATKEGEQKQGEHK